MPRRLSPVRRKVQPCALATLLLPEIRDRAAKPVKRNRSPV
jgi:hypothetical protein